MTQTVSRYPPPGSWADFWDVKTFPGPRSLPNHGTPWVVLAAALLADGLTVRDLHPPLDFDRAFKKLDAIKPQVTVWWKSGDQSLQLMRGGDVAMMMIYSGPALRGQSQGAPIGMTWNQAVMGSGRWTILKNAPNQKAAMTFLDYFLSRPEAHAAFTSRFSMTPRTRTQSTSCRPIGARTACCTRTI